MVRGTDGLACAGNDGTKELRMSFAGLSLAPPPEVATSGDHGQCQEYGKHGREPSRERGPVYIDETEPIVGLIEGNVVGLVDVVVHAEVGFVLEDDRGSRSGCGS